MGKEKEKDRRENNDDNVDDREGENIGHSHPSLLISSSSSKASSH
jgi:hypothetical protein